MSESKLCYWCCEPLPPLPEDASYVDEINHVRPAVRSSPPRDIHDACRKERDDRSRRTDELGAAIASGIDSLPEVVRNAVLDRLESNGFARRCPCLYDADHGFQGYGSHSWGSDGECCDARNSIEGCELCGGTGTHDPLPQLLELTDDTQAAAWVERELPRSSGYKSWEVDCRQDDFWIPNCPGCNPAGALWNIARSPYLMYPCPDKPLGDEAACQSLRGRTN
jgi:hypothetical protein